MPNSLPGAASSCPGGKTFPTLVVPGMHIAEPVIPVKAEETKLLVVGRAFPIDRAFSVQMFLPGVFGEEKGGRKQNRLTGFCCFFTTGITVIVIKPTGLHAAVVISCITVKILVIAVVPTYIIAGTAPLPSFLLHAIPTASAIHPPAFRHMQRTCAIHPAIGKQAMDTRTV